MTAYKVGDKVLVKDDLVIGRNYYMFDKSVRDSFVGSMKDIKGKVATIKKIGTNGKYNLLEDDYYFNWTDEMFLGKVIDKDTYKVGDIVLVKDDLEVNDVYGEIILLESMNYLAGKTAKVTNVFEDNCNDDLFYELDGKYTYSKEMFVGAVVDPRTYVVKEEQKEVEAPQTTRRVSHQQMEVTFGIRVEKVIYNDPATILFYRVPKLDFSTGMITGYSNVRKVVAKCNKKDGDVYSESKGLEVAILKAVKSMADRELRKI